MYRFRFRVPMSSKEATRRPKEEEERTKQRKLESAVNDVGEEEAAAFGWPFAALQPWPGLNRPTDRLLWTNPIYPRHCKVESRLSGELRQDSAPFTPFRWLYTPKQYRMENFLSFFSQGRCNKKPFFSQSKRHETKLLNEAKTFLGPCRWSRLRYIKWTYSVLIGLFSRVRRE